MRNDYVLQIAGWAEETVDLAAGLRQVPAAGRHETPVECRGCEVRRGRRRGRTRLAGWADLEDGGLNPANILWIFCVARSGSTWLAEMMGEIGGHKVWKEPRVGHLFGEFYVNTPREKTRSANFIMGEPTRDGWIHAIRNFVLTGARHTFPSSGRRTTSWSRSRAAAWGPRS